MTRSHRAIQLPSACLALGLLLLSSLAATPAQAGIFDFLLSKKSAETADKPQADNTPPTAEDQDDDSDDSNASALTAAASNAVATAASAATQSMANAAVPTVERLGKFLSCVPYARERSGVQIFGDAKLWWDHAKDLYARMTQPAADAVMVFSGSSRIRRGHVAVVTAILSPREIKVDHANWQNHGEVDLNMPVLDVSKDNDWSQVRVWDPGTNQFGARTYNVSGFIARTAPATNGS